MKSNHHRFSVHKFSQIGEQASFSAEEYSQFKFGSDLYAKIFGHQLAERFFEEHSDWLIANECLVIPSPYNYVKNAATVMTRHFMNRLNELLVEAAGKHAEYMTVQRKVSYTNDYGFLSKERRKGLIDNDTFFINNEYVYGKALIFIDDVRITGTHEDKLVEVLEQRGLDNPTFFLYFGEYFGNDPSIEAKLNFAAVSSPSDFVKITYQPNHHMIVRPIKYMLGLGAEDFNSTINDLSTQKAQTMYYGALHEGYHKIPSYQQNFAELRRIANRKKGAEMEQ